MRTFEVTVGNTLLDVPARILQRPVILYGQVSVNFKSLLSNIFNWDVLPNVCLRVKLYDDKLSVSCGLRQVFS